MIGCRKVIDWLATLSELRKRHVSGCGEWGGTINDGPPSFPSRSTTNTMLRAQKVMLKCIT
jgi:hypothetical protein